MAADSEWLSAPRCMSWTSESPVKVNFVEHLASLRLPVPSHDGRLGRPRRARPSPERGRAEYQGASLQLLRHPGGEGLGDHRGGQVGDDRPLARGLLMVCELCGGGDRWIKTCLTPEGYHLLVCDPCWDEHRHELTIVPGDWIVTARCEGCGTYGNPREFSELFLGGRHSRWSVGTI